MNTIDGRSKVSSSEGRGTFVVALLAHDEKAISEYTDEVCGGLDPPLRNRTPEIVPPKSLCVSCEHLPE